MFQGHGGYERSFSQLALSREGEACLPAWERRAALPEFMQEGQVQAREHLPGLCWQKGVVTFEELDGV